MTGGFRIHSAYCNVTGFVANWFSLIIRTKQVITVINNSIAHK